MRLSDVPPSPADEPLLSFASRIARCHGTDLPTFCHEVGLSRRGLVDGSEDACRRMADLTGHDPAGTAERAFRRDGHVWRFKGQVLHRVGMRRVALCVCPLCLGEDAAGSRSRPDRAAYVRAHWLAKAVRTCVRHGVSLVDVVEPEASVGRAVHDFARRLAPTLLEVDRLVGDARPRSPTSLERYVVERMHGGPVDGGLADAMPLYAAVRTCEMLGVAILFGPRTRTRSLGGDDWRVAGAVGFDVASLGARATFDSLATVMRAQVGAEKYAGGNKAFGRLYGWLKTEDSGPDYEPFRALLREVIFETLPLAAGTEVLGVRLDRRRVHSLRSAALATGRGPKGLRRDLGAMGVLPAADGEAEGRPVAIPVGQADGMMAGLGASLPRARAAERVGATVADMASLAKAGLLAPLTPRSGSCRSHVRFSVQALDDFLVRLGRRVTDVMPTGARARDVPTAARLSNRGLARVTAALLDGRLRHVARLTGATGFRSVLVDVDEVVETRVADDGRFDVDGVALRLSVTRATALDLIKAGHLLARSVAAPSGRRTSTVVDEASLARFASTFVSLGELSRELAVGWTPLKKRLEAAGVTPAFPFDRTRSVLYHRRDVAGPGGPTPSGPTSSIVGRTIKAPHRSPNRSNPGMRS